ncbi:uncharacterized protein LOC121874672 [Homarus americanus]|uniref:uncharacterized protein LOC121874672 n=1 Tax=Homarus americanus TaxID=6706 RepID=UPI001C4612B3|nr:uncharacterized protein LOC121874672 [Homarus americanus]
MKSKKFWMSWSKRGWPETIDGSGWILQGFHRRRVYAEVSAIKTVCYSLVTRNWTPSSSFQKQERSPYLTKTQLLVALYYLATGDLQLTVGLGRYVTGKRLSINQEGYPCHHHHCTTIHSVPFPSRGDYCHAGVLCHCEHAMLYWLH